MQFSNFPNTISGYPWSYASNLPEWFNIILYMQQLFIEFLLCAKWFSRYFFVDKQCYIVIENVNADVRPPRFKSLLHFLLARYIIPLSFNFLIFIMGIIIKFQYQMLLKFVCVCCFDQYLGCYKHFINVNDMNHYDIVNTTTSAINIIHINVELAFSRNFQAFFSEKIVNW